MNIKTTACPRNCYSTCSMRVLVKDGRLRSIEAHPANRAAQEGVCLKGLSYIERVYSDKRILTPLFRTKGKSRFEQITWPQALEILTEKLLHLKAKYGPQSILYYFGSGTKGLLNSVGINFWRLFGGCTVTYGDLCWPAGLEATRLMLGDNKHNAPWDIANAGLIILWGKNPAETNIHQMVFIEQALENGGQLIVIDPRRTQSSERANLLIQPRPGSDGALALAVAHILINEKMIDEDFINHHIIGFNQYKQVVKGMTPEKAAYISDVPKKTIDQLAELIAIKPPVTINAGYGMQRYTNSGQTIRTIIALLAITGNIGKPGAGWIYANLQSHIFDRIKDPLAFYPHEKPDDLIRQSVSTALLGQHMLAEKNPPIKMIWVERGNPLSQNPETPTVQKAFRSLDFRVVIDQFLTDTAREADLILPAKTMFEQSDIIGAYWHSYIQFKQKVIEPPGQVKPETEVYYLLAQKLGYDLKDIKELIPGPSDAEIEDYLRKRLVPFPELSLEQLKNKPLLSPMQEEIAFENLIFSTPSGKIELLSEEAVSRWGVKSLPTFEEPSEAADKTEKTQMLYPLHFMTPNTKNGIHSQFKNLKVIRQFSEKPLLQIHPHDAGIRRISDGEKVRVFNDRGSITIEAFLDYSIRKGCVAVSNGWWLTDGAPVNVLSLGRETDMGYGAAFHENRVQVERTD